jgi:hypothetical protein
VLARLNDPVIAGVIAQAGWLAFAAARLYRWAGGQLSLFVMAGTEYTDPARMVPAIAHVPRKGYDGQFFYRFALNPVNWHPTAYGITIDHPYRYTRIGYPVLAWLLSSGGHGALLPAALALINLVSVAVLAWLGGVFARQAGRHALWGLLLAAYFGLVISVGRDTAEPLADACLLGGLLAYRDRRFVFAALLLSCAVVTNEPVLVIPLALSLTRLWQVWRRSASPGWPDLAWALPGFLYAALQGVQHVVVGGAVGGVADASANLTWPFTALVPGSWRDVTRLNWTHLGPYDYNMVEFLALALFVVAGLLVVRSSAAPPHERVAFAGLVLVEVVMASSQFWYSVFGDGRIFVDTYEMAVLLLIAAPDRVVTNRRLAALGCVAVATLVVVARRRILFE